jgi:carboxymethylenebutenolidase
MRSVLAWSLLLLTGCVAPPAPTAAHDPAPAAATETVSFPSGQDTVRGVLCRPAGKGPFPAVVVVHDDRGLTDWVKEQARRLADHGYAALAVDLYRGQVADTLEDAHILSRGLPDDQVLSDLKAAVTYLATRPDVRAEAVGILGWDIGGGYALDAALRDPRLRAVVTCSGRLTTDPDRLRALNAPVLGLFGGKDEGITPETVSRFQAAMEKAGKRAPQVEVYTTCGHDFMQAAGGSGREAKAAAAAWGKIDSFLAAELGH